MMAKVVCFVAFSQVLILYAGGLRRVRNLRRNKPIRPIDSRLNGRDVTQKISQNEVGGKERKSVPAAVTAEPGRFPLLTIIGNHEDCSTVFRFKVDTVRFSGFSTFEAKRERNLEETRPTVPIAAFCDQPTSFSHNPPLLVERKGPLQNVAFATFSGLT